MKYQLKEFNRNISDTELLDDLKRVANKLGIKTLTSREYDGNGCKYTSGTIHRRFGSWNTALKKAGLKSALKQNISEVELFKNMEDVWIKLGRQPVSRDMKRPLSEFSPSAYLKKFNTFRNALEAFVEYINSDNANNQEKGIIGDEENTNEPTLDDEIIFKHKTKRIPSERLKVQVLMRDGNKCKLCGITVTGEDIHFDHIKPWSKGGETVLENLQILCAKHNLAKGNVE